MNTFKIVSLALLAAVFSQCTQAQSLTKTKIDSTKTEKAKNIYAEFGGPGFFISANYDTRFSNQRGGIGWRAGLGYSPPLTNIYTTTLLVPVQVNYLLGRKSNFLEFGAGATLLIFPANPVAVQFKNTLLSNPAILGTFTLGYRYQPINGGFNFRANLNPVFNSSSFALFEYVGLSFGYTFK